MANPFVIGSATLNKDAKLVCFVDLSLLEVDEGNGAIFGLVKDDLSPLYSLDRQILDISFQPRSGHLYVLTHELVFRFSELIRESDPEVILQSPADDPFKKMLLTENAVFLVTMTDRLIKADLPGGVSVHLPCPLGEASGIENLYCSDSVLKYVVGWQGMILNYDKERWVEISAPTNKIFSAISETQDGELVVVGQSGILVYGAPDALEVIDHDWEGYDFWDVTVFGKKVFLLSEVGVFELNAAKEVVPVIGREQERSIFFSFKRSDALLWAVGERNILEYDGSDWVEVFALSA